MEKLNKYGFEYNCGEFHKIISFQSTIDSCVLENLFLTDNFNIKDLFLSFDRIMNDNNIEFSSFACDDETKESITFIFDSFDKELELKKQNYDYYYDCGEYNLSDNKQMIQYAGKYENGIYKLLFHGFYDGNYDSFDKLQLLEMLDINGKTGTNYVSYNIPENNKVLSFNPIDMIANLKNINSRNDLKNHYLVQLTNKK